MRKVLQELFDQKRLSREEARDTLVEISKGETDDALIAAFLTVFRMRPITKDELHGFRDALLQLRIPIDLKGRDATDLVGTGGDSKNTFNISTLSAFVVAGAGYNVVKHGNYGVSSISGSSNVLESLGYIFTADEDEINRRLDHCQLTFLHAPLFHPALKSVAPIRRAFGMKTFFNQLGPLVNPAQPRCHFLGVYDLNLSRLYQYILQESNNPFAVIYSMDGYDEISLTDKFSYRSNDSDLLLSPGDLGLPVVSPEGLHGGDSIDAAAKIFVDILEGRGTDAQNSVICANAGLAIQLFHPTRSFIDCIALAKESLESGRALGCLKKAVE